MVDVDRYWKDGYYLPLDVLTQKQVGLERKELETLLDHWTDDPGLVRPMTDYRRSNFHVVSRWGAQIAQTPAVLDAVEAVIGPDILCWMTEVIIKEPGVEKIISMHQDLTYWGMDDENKQVTAWLALTDATPENGCMSFVRGSHRQGQVDHNDTFAENNVLSRGQQVAVEYDKADLITCALKAGQISLHHGHMFHGSGPNRTDERRIGIVMRFISPEMKPKVAKRDYALLVRGANRTGHYATVAPPAKDFSATAMALYEEIDGAQMEALADGVDGEFRYG